MADNTFLGLQPYTEDDAYRFKGRTEESQELFRLIVRNDFTVCYAESGEGKTSLLNAGVFPLLRENMFFPIAITFTSDDYKVTPDSFDAIIDRCIKDSIAENNEKNKGVNVEYKLCSTDFQGLDSQAELQRELGKYSWWKLRNYKPQAMGLTFTPVFVFDQFEEVFNLPGSIVWTKKFFDWLEDVSSDSCPEEIVRKVREIIGDKAAFPAIKEEKGFKAVFSLRKEFIGELDYWGIQKCFIPSLKDNRYCLKALTYEGAKKVMTQQERFDEEKVEQILTHFVSQYSREPEKTIAENLPAIPALLLSVVCDFWEKDIAAFTKLSTDEIGQSLNNILENFYDETIEAVIKELVSQNKEAVTPDPIRKDIDTALFDLVDVNGKRVRVKAVTTLGTISMDSGKRFSETLPIAKYKEILNKHRIIKITKIDGEDYVEIVHDCLCPIIAKRRERRFAVETKEREERLLREQAKKLRKRLSLFGLLAIVVLGVMTLFFYQNRRNQIVEQNLNQTQVSLILSKSEKDSIQKQKDKVLELNEALIALNQIYEMQKDSLNELALTLSKKNKELERSIAQNIEKQKVIDGRSQMGYVKTSGRPGEKGHPLAGVTIQIAGRPAVLSNSEGNFWIGINHGEDFRITAVRKQGYELLNPDVILNRRQVASDAPIVIVLCETEKLLADKKRIEDYAYKIAEKKYQQKIAVLEKEKEKNAIAAEQYREQLQLLQMQFETSISNVGEMADRYARTDYDGLSEMGLEINRCIENGNLERADSLINLSKKQIDVLIKKLERIKLSDR